MQGSIAISKLIIDEVEPRHLGTYDCTAIDKALTKYQVAFKTPLQDQQRGLLTEPETGLYMWKLAETCSLYSTLIIIQKETELKNFQSWLSFEGSNLLRFTKVFKHLYTLHNKIVFIV